MILIPFELFLRTYDAAGFFMDENTESSNTSRSRHEFTKEEIKQSLSNHVKWVLSNGQEGEMADFQKAQLKGAVFMGANLRQASFKGAHLYGAYLKKTDLENANLEGSNLRNANLRWANLENTNLKEANLVRADFHEANMKLTQLQGANLKMAAGLTREQIEMARVDETTILPEYL